VGLLPRVNGVLEVGEALPGRLRRINAYPGLHISRATWQLGQTGEQLEDRSDYLPGAMGLEENATSLRWPGVGVPSGRALRRKLHFAAVIRSQQTAEPDFFCYFLRKPHEGAFRMVAVWAFEGPLSVIGAMGLDTRRHHHRPALWARWPFSRDRSWGCETETEHVIFLSRAGAFTRLSGASGDHYQFFADAKRGTGNGRFDALASLPRHRATTRCRQSLPE
jgi:hypothetical protein